jgi:hypothetical protein
MTERTEIHEEHAFAEKAWRDAREALRERHRNGEHIYDLGDFLAREIDEAYRIRATHKRGEPAHA